MRIGVDLGGTKIEVAALDATGRVLLRRRTPTPTTHPGVVEAIGRLVEEAERALGARGTVGVGIPGSLSPATGLVRGANSTFLNGTPLDRDLGARLGREVRLSNDANCLALSEAAEGGAAAGASPVFAAILGTGVGAGIVVGGRILEGFNRIGGEWGHNPLPWMTQGEFPGPTCWCGKRGCIETFCSGPALAALADGEGTRDASGLPARAAAGEARAQAALELHLDRLARALAHVANLLDPEVIVLGGGLSNMAHLPARLPAAMRPWVFADHVVTRVVAARHGDSSGVFGAARLWG